MSLFGKVVMGIDFGHASVKVVGVSVGKHPKVIGCGETPIDPKLLAKTGIEDPAAVAQAIRDAMQVALPGKIVTTEACAAVSEEVVFRKVIELPASLTPEELPQMIRTEAVEYLPDDIGNLELDYQLIGQPVADLQQVMIVSVAKKVVEDRLAVMEAAKLKPVGIDPKPSAIGRAVVSPQESDPIVLIDIGTEMTSISVYADHAIWVTGTVTMGGHIIRDPATGEVDEAKKDDKLDRLADGIGDELSHVLKFYQNRVSGQRGVSEIRLCGGGSMIEGITARIQKQSQIPVVEASPVVPLPEGSDRRFLGALGSALYPLYEAL